MPVDDYIPKTSDVALTRTCETEFGIAGPWQVHILDSYVSSWVYQKHPELGHRWSEGRREEQEDSRASLYGQEERILALVGCDVSLLRKSITRKQHQQPIRGTPGGNFVKRIEHEISP